MYTQAHAREDNRRRLSLPPMNSTAATVPQQQRRRHTVVADSLFSVPDSKLRARKASSIYMPRKKSLEAKEEAEREARKVEALEAARQTRMASNWEMVSTVNAADG